MMTGACNLSVWAMEAAGTRFQRHLQLHRELKEGQASQVTQDLD